MAEAQRLLNSTRVSLSQLSKEWEQERGTLLGKEQFDADQGDLPFRALRDSDRQRCRQIFQRANSPLVGLEHLRVLLTEVNGDRISDNVYQQAMQVMEHKDGQFNEEEFLAACSVLPPREEDSDPVEPNGKPTEAPEKGSTDDGPMSKQFRNKGVRKDVVVAYLQKEKEERNACLQLPTNFIMVMCFFFAVTGHFHFDKLYAIDHAIIYDIEENGNFAFSGIYPWENGRIGHKNVHDVNIIPDFYSWFSLGMVPLWWASNETWGYQETRANVISQCTGARTALESQGWPADVVENITDTPPGYGYGGVGHLTCPGEWGGWQGIPIDYGDGEDLKLVGPDFTPTYLYYNTVIGGLRMTQEQTNWRACLGHGYAYPAHGGRCLEEADNWLRPETHEALALDKDRINQPGGETIYLLSRWSQPYVLQKVQELENRAWFSPKTSKIELLYTTFNAHANLVTAHLIIMLVNRAGHIHKVIDPISIWIDPYETAWSYVFDIIWVLLTLKLVCEEGLEIMKRWLTYGIIHGTRDYVTFWNTIDWLSIVFSISIVVMWILHLFELKELRRLIGLADHEVPGSWTDPKDREDFFELVHRLAEDSRNFRMILAAFPFVIGVSKFFKAFNSQPRLAMVTKTIWQASVDIAHFAVVFFTIFSIFAISGMILFGEEDYEYANFHRSFQSTFHALLGNYDWDSLIKPGRPQALLWFWGLIWIVDYVMLNMLLAIVMDIFLAVKKDVLSRAQVETLWSQAREIYLTYLGVWKGELLSLSHVLDKLIGQDIDISTEAMEDVVLNTETLVQLVPGISEAQALDILQSALDFKPTYDHETEEEKDTHIKNLHDSMQMVIHELRHRSAEGISGMSVGGYWHQGQDPWKGLSHLNTPLSSHITPPSWSPWQSGSTANGQKGDSMFNI